MNKTLKLIIGVVFTILVLWGIVFFIDYNRCSNLKIPIFVIGKDTADDGGSGTYYGLGYRVEVEKNISAEYGEQLIRTEIYFGDKCIVGAIADLASKTEGVTTVLSLEDEIKNDTIWCGTFQLIWNDLKNDLAKQDIVFTPQLEMVENLNKETFSIKDISEEYYYKKIGTPSVELKHEIEKAIKQKFNETSDILDDFEWEESGLKDYFLYVMLKKEFKFENAFEKLEEGKFAEYDNVSYFGIKENDAKEVRKQVDVLYYNSKNDFAIKLKTKQDDEVILCKNPKGKTFKEIYDNVKKQEEKYKGDKNLKENELLKIPDIKINEKNEFTQIQNKPFYFSNGDEYQIEKAIQTIKFELDREGGKIKSEAGMMTELTSALLKPKEKREFFIDDTFAIFLIEENKYTPYFAAKINDITKFQ